MCNLKIEKHCLTSWQNIGTNVLSCCNLAEHVDSWFRGSAELRCAMCNVGWPDAVMCSPLLAMLARVA